MVGQSGPTVAVNAAEYCQGLNKKEPYLNLSLGEEKATTAKQYHKSKDRHLSVTGTFNIVIIFALRQYSVDAVPM